MAHISYNERKTIENLVKTNPFISCDKLSIYLGRGRNTIYRELKAGGFSNTNRKYSADVAQANYRKKIA